MFYCKYEFDKDQYPAVLQGILSNTSLSEKSVESNMCISRAKNDLFKVSPCGNQGRTSGDPFTCV